MTTVTLPAGILWLVLLGLSLSSCAVVPPRLPAPLPAHGVAVTAFGGAAVGVEWDNDYSPGYSLAWGGANVAWQALAFDGIAVELDAGAGAGVGHVRGGVGPHLGFSSAARVWYQQERWAAGVDAGIVTTFPASNRARIDARFLPEFRLLGAWHVTDNVWLGTRPGVFVPVPLEIAYPVPVFDLPIALIIDVAPFRLGAEVGACGFIQPTCLHAGLSAGFVL